MAWPVLVTTWTTCAVGVLDADPPAALGDLPAHGDVTAEADEEPAGEPLGEQRGDRVGGIPLGARAEVEQAALGDRRPGRSRRRA